MDLHLSIEKYKNIDYFKINFSPNTKKSIIYDYRSNLKQKQKEDLIDIKGQEIFLAHLFSVASLRQSLIYYNQYEKLNITFDEKAEAFFKSINPEHKDISQDLSLEKIIEILKANGFERNLEKFQLSNLKDLLAMQHGMNFSVPGAGKTSVTLALHTILKETKSSDIDSLFVVAPLNAFGSSEDEIIECYNKEVAETMKLTRLEGSQEEIFNQLN